MFTSSAFFNQHVIFFFKENTWLSVSSNNQLLLVCIHIGRVHYTLHDHSKASWISHWIDPSPLALLLHFLSKNACLQCRSSYFLINLPLIPLLLSRGILQLYANPFGLRFLDFLIFLSRPSELTSSLVAFWFTHFEQLLSPGKLNTPLWPSTASCPAQMTLTY